VKESDIEIMAEMGGERDLGYNWALEGIECNVCVSLRGGRMLEAHYILPFI
jgi:hypothetical protein